MHHAKDIGPKGVDFDWISVIKTLPTHTRTILNNIHGYFINMHEFKICVQYKLVIVYVCVVGVLIVGSIILVRNHDLIQLKSCWIFMQWAASRLDEWQLHCSRCLYLALRWRLHATCYLYVLIGTYYRFRHWNIILRETTSK